MSNDALKKSKKQTEFEMRCKRFFAHLILEEGLDENLKSDTEWQHWVRYHTIPTEKDEIRRIIVRLIPPDFLQFNTFSVVVKPGKEKTVKRMMTKAGITLGMIKEQLKWNAGESYLARQSLMERNKKLDEREKKYLKFIQEKYGKS